MADASPCGHNYVSFDVAAQLETVLSTCQAVKSAALLRLGAVKTGGVAVHRRVSAAAILDHPPSESEPDPHPLPALQPVFAPPPASRSAVCYLRPTFDSHTLAHMHVTCQMRRNRSAAFLAIFRTLRKIVCQSLVICRAVRAQVLMSEPEDTPVKHRCLVRVTAVQPEVKRMCRRPSELASDAQHSACGRRQYMH